MSQTVPAMPYAAPRHRDDSLTASAALLELDPPTRAACDCFAGLADDVPHSTYCARYGADMYALGDSKHRRV